MSTKGKKKALKKTKTGKSLTAAKVNFPATLRHALPHFLFVHVSFLCLLWLCRVCEMDVIEDGLFTKFISFLTPSSLPQWVLSIMLVVQVK